MDMVHELSRIVLSIFFFFHGANHLLNLKSLTAYAERKKAPMPQASVVAGGVVLLFGGVSYMFSYNVQTGAVLVSAFLVASALLAHRFWSESDPDEKSNEMAHFLKNFAIAAGVMLSSGAAV